MRLSRCLFSALCLVVFAAAPAGAAERSIEDFYGKYVGSTVDTAVGEIEPRYLDVTIAPLEKGFGVEWTTIIAKAGESPRASTQTILFRPSKREGVYASAMKRNMFGQMVPLDPIEGDPYSWAGINGDTLSVYSLIILGSDSYELQQYDRTLVDGGLDLRFVRIRNGETLREIRGRLTRAEK